jgi:ribosome modulation factor
MDRFSTFLPDIKLRFNIEHPNLEECYIYGYECALANIGEDENPYRSGSKESENWIEGWWAGFYGDKPLYELADKGAVASDSTVINAANDQFYHESVGHFFAKVMEITGIIVVSAVVGFQLMDLVA